VARFHKIVGKAPAVTFEAATTMKLKESMSDDLAPPTGPSPLAISTELDEQGNSDS